MVLLICADKNFHAILAGDAQGGILVWRPNKRFNIVRSSFENMLCFFYRCVAAKALNGVVVSLLLPLLPTGLVSPATDCIALRCHR